MNEQQLITLCILIVGLLSGAWIAWRSPKMRRVFWMVRLCIAMLVFGSFALLLTYKELTHWNLHAKGFFSLACNAYIVWICLQYLRVKLADDTSESSRCEQRPNRSANRT